MKKYDTLSHWEKIGSDTTYDFRSFGFTTISLIMEMINDTTKKVYIKCRKCNALHPANQCKHGFKIKLDSRKFDE